MDNEVMFSSNSDEWNTPDIILDAIREIEGTIGLDPCSNSQSKVNAKESFSLFNGQDGLKESWQHKSCTFVNPPHSKIKIWCKKIYDEFQEDRQFNGMLRQESKNSFYLLIPARTDTMYFHEYCFRGSAICFIRGRLRFSNSKNSAPFPSAVVYYGNKVEEFERVFSSLGCVIILR